jgi:hypothetical protein
MMPVFVALAGRAVPGAEPTTGKTATLKSSCIDCHLQLDGEALEAAKRIGEDVHFQHGLSCHDCHGGNPAAGADGDIAAAHDEKKGWTGKPKRLAIPVFCARCHADAAFMKGFNPQMRVDQLSEYRTSVHGKRNAAGDERVAVCVDCHGVHGIRPPKDPRSPVHAARVAETCGRCHTNVELMRAYGLPSNQYAGYKTSVHAHALYDKGDVSSPTCNDCHGSHGAAPPGMQTVVQVCGSCHTREATLFRDIEKKKGLDLTPCIQCMVCHDNHAVQAPTDDMLGVGPKSTCTSCHGAGTAPYKAAEEMAAALEGLKGRVAVATDLLSRAERAGIEVSVDQFALRKARDQVVEARVLAHSFDSVRFLAVTAEGLAVAEEGANAGRRASRELGQRRLGLAVSLVVIFAVIVGLVLKVRQIEGRGVE